MTESEDDRRERKITEGWRQYGRYIAIALGVAVLVAVLASMCGRG